MFFTYLHFACSIDEVLPIRKVKLPLTYLTLGLTWLFLFMMISTTLLGLLILAYGQVHELMDDGTECGDFFQPMIKIWFILTLSSCQFQSMFVFFSLIKIGPLVNKVLE